MLIMVMSKLYLSPFEKPCHDLHRARVRNFDSTYAHFCLFAANMFLFSYCYLA